MGLAVLMAVRAQALCIQAGGKHWHQGHAQPCYGEQEPNDYQLNKDISGDLNTVLYLKFQFKCGHSLPFESYKQMTVVTPKHQKMI